MRAEGERLVDLFIKGSLNESTKIGCCSKFRIWAEEREKAGKGLWLLERCRKCGERVDCLHDVEISRAQNQSGTIRGCLPAIKYFHQLYARWELPTSHFRVLAVSNAIELAYAKLKLKPRVRNPLTFSMLTKGTETLGQTTGGEFVTWMGLSFSYFLLSRASELWAYGHGLECADFCLGRGNFDVL